MNKRYLLGFTAGFLLAVGSAWVSIAHAAIYSSISGHVIAEDTGKGVPGMRVVLMGPDEWRKGVYTDANGFYIFDDLTPDTYTLIFFQNLSNTDYAKYYVSKRKIGIEVHTGKNIMNQNFILKVGGSISGQVYQNDGTPYRNSDFIVTVSGGNSGEITKADGSFFIQGIPPANNVEVSIGAFGYYIQNARQTVQVVKSQTTTGVNFTLPPTDTGIVGIVIDTTTNAPIPYVNVNVYDLKGALLPVTGVSDANGLYKIYGLSPGVYTLNAGVAYYEDFNSSAITVISKQISTYNFAMKRKQTSFNEFIIGKLKKMFAESWPDEFGQRHK